MVAINFTLPKQIGEKRSNGLEPIPGHPGLYRSPDVVSPRDCENYPDSPYCGGNPINRKKFVDISVKTGFDRCEEDGGWNAHVSVQGTLGFTKLPKHTLAQISEGCRSKYDPPKPKPVKESQLEDPPPTNWDDTIDPNERVILVFGVRAGAWAKATMQDDPPIYRYGELAGAGLEYPVEDYLTAAQNQANQGWYYLYRSAPRYGQAIAKITQRVRTISLTPSVSANQTFYLLADDWMRMSFDLDEETINYPVIGYGNWIWVVQGKYGDIRYLTYRNSNLKVFEPYRFQEGDSDNTRWWEILRTVRLNPLPQTNIDRIPRKPNKRKCCDMPCCTPVDYPRTNDDLAEILQELKDIKKYIGYREKITVPEHLCTMYDDSGNKQTPATKTITNLTEFLGWMVKALDSSLGEFGLALQIEDADPEKEGNQSKTIVFQNLAEAIAELYSLSFDQFLTNHQLMQLNSKLMVQQSMSYRTGVQAYHAVMALVDFFGFKQQEIKTQVPFMCSIGEERFEDFIKEKTQEVQVIDFDPNDKNSQSYKDDMLELRHMAAMFRAQNWRKMDKNGDLGKQLVDIAKMGLKHMDKINQNKIDPKDPDKEVNNDFAQFCEDAETQFSRQTGINPEKPWGIEYDKRPKITKLTQEASKDSTDTSGS